MTPVIYVDQLIAYHQAPQAGAERHFGNGKQSCHMSSPDLDALHAFAKRLGLKREWFQEGRVPHYDLTPPKRHKALMMGAQEVESRVLIMLCRRPGQPTDELRTRENQMGIQVDQAVRKLTEIEETIPDILEKLRKARAWLNESRSGSCHPLGWGNEVPAEVRQAVAQGLGFYNDLNKLLLALQPLAADAWVAVSLAYHFATAELDNNLEPIA